MKNLQFGCAHIQRLSRHLLIATLLACCEGRLSFATVEADPQLHLKTDAQATPLFAHNDNNDNINSSADKPQPEIAAAYMDSLLSDPVAARSRLCGKFTKRSTIAVVYMCYERREMIQRAIPAILQSEGLSDFDLFISQDGGAVSIFFDELLSIPESTHYVYIQHTANLCTGLHQHFVKAFAFDIMGYDTVIIIEEDNVVHPQALQLLARMAELSVSEPSIGAVSILDMDMSAFLDAGQFGSGIIPTLGTMGHLWVFGLHRSKYQLIKGCMDDYYNVIKGNDYRAKHRPPLRNAIEALMQEKGFPLGGALSQDRWFHLSLAKYGFQRRYQSLFRFFEPIGYYGLHFKLHEADFYGRFGRQMFSGRINPAAAFDVTKDPHQPEVMKEVVKARLVSLYSKYRGLAQPSEKLVNDTFNSLLEGRLNGLEVVRNIVMGSRKSPPPLAK